MPYQNEIKAVLFDMDGTLINSNESDMLAFQFLMKSKLGLEISYEKMKTNFGAPTKTILREYVPEAEIEEMFRGWLDAKIRFSDSIQVFSGIIPLLEDLKRSGILLAVVTSQFELESAIIRDHFSLHKYFNAWVTLDNSLHPKPDPAPVNAALKLLSVEPDQAIMIGDTTFDIDAGQNAGTLTGVAMWGARDKPTLLARNPDYSFSHPKDVQSIFELQPRSAPTLN